MSWSPSSSSTSFFFLHCCNSGKNSNSSQFFVTLAPAPQLNSKHVVFGKLTSGFQVLELIEQSLTTQAKGDENPCVPLIITSCGEFIEGRDMEQGYWGEDDIFHHPLAK